MEKSNRASVEIGIGWETPSVRHMDRYFFNSVNFWRDFFPGELACKLSDAGVGHGVSESYPAGELLPAWDARNVARVREHGLKTGANGSKVALRSGRFYPKGFLGALPGVYPQDRHPFRYLGTQDGMHVVDMNHPLAGVDLIVEATVVEQFDEKEERGGRCNDVVHEVCENGPGLQRDPKSGETDFFSGSPFTRQDMTDDAQFYAGARMVNHIDNVAMQRIRSIYAGRLRPGMRVLDLMSSCNSHLPSEMVNLSVTGLGMNREELASNPQLTEYVVHDLNQTHTLPFDNERFDAAVCTVSVEYLTSPIEVFQEVARVLRPASPFIVTFSDRWFPPKVVRIWTELHPFERVGLVKAYFQRSKRFSNLQTESIRGYLRPADDKYARLTPLSDPVFVVSGTSTAWHCRRKRSMQNSCE